MAGNSSEQVTSPDQRKPTNFKLGRIGAILTALVLLAMIPGNHQGNLENIWLIAIAALLVGTVVADWVLRRNGLR